MAAEGRGGGGGEVLYFFLVILLVFFSSFHHPFTFMTSSLLCRFTFPPSFTFLIWLINNLPCSYLVVFVFGVVVVVIVVVTTLCRYSHCDYIGHVYVAMSSEDRE